MSLTPRLTLIGLYKYNPAVFSNLTLPAAVDEETFIDSLLLEYGECPLIYPDYDFMVLAIGAWSRKWYSNIEKIASVLESEYNPIHNYNRTEEWKENEKSENEYTINKETNGNTNNDGTNENQISAYNENTYQPDNKTIEENNGEYNENSEDNYTGKSERGNDKVGRAYGNIGVTTSQQMINEELSLRTNENLYHIIAQLFYSEFCLYVF